ncbi:hypothetical protein GQ54DRAFT_175461 [Martensiomyces pterosporus]|nr:hypothetical protein GQ54DRAFT_175461 [Martensiomyces pterosporus]
MDETDPFEARLLFGNMLDNLTGAQPTIDRVSSFAIKNSGMADNLLDCITEKLDRLAVAPRLNILYLVDAILTAEARSGTHTWTDLMRRDLLKVVQAVVPENSSGDANVPHVRKVVAGWRSIKQSDKSLTAKIDKVLANRADGNPNPSGLKHQEILRRIEEDRERHKRHKEDIWIRPSGEDPADELSTYWETTSDLNDADWQEIAEENAAYQQERRVLDVAQNAVLLFFPSPTISSFIYQFRASGLSDPGILSFIKSGTAECTGQNPHVARSPNPSSRPNGPHCLWTLALAQKTKMQLQLAVAATTRQFQWPESDEFPAQHLQYEAH